MPDWVDLVRDTSEFSRGEWSGSIPDDVRANHTAHIEVHTEGGQRVIAHALPCHFYTVNAIREGVTHGDAERDANCRLLADAPMFLLVLAHLRRAWDMREKTPRVADHMLSTVMGKAEELILRHVRPEHAVDADDSTAEAPLPDIAKEQADFLRSVGE